MADLIQVGVPRPSRDHLSRPRLLEGVAGGLYLACGNALAIHVLDGYRALFAVALVSVAASALLLVTRVGQTTHQGGAA